MLERSVDILHDYEIGIPSKENESRIGNSSQWGYYDYTIAHFYSHFHDVAFERLWVDEQYLLEERTAGWRRGHDR